MIKLKIFPRFYLFLCILWLSIENVLPAFRESYYFSKFNSEYGINLQKAEGGNLTEVEYKSLHDLYQATDGRAWKWYNTTPYTRPWDFEDSTLSSPCSDSWQGITCFCFSGRCTVKELFLSQHNLTGTFPESIGNLTSLTQLTLSDNALNGTIPTSIGSLSNMLLIDLDRNHLTGTIPTEIKEMKQLSELTLSRNNFTGYLPEEIFTLKNLSVLELDFNTFHGSLSSSIGNLTNLGILKLDENRFHGPLPRAIGNLQNLSNLLISNNNFSQSIPEEFYSLTKLKLVDISANFFTGRISASIGSLTLLRGFFAQVNNFVGYLPDALWSAQIPLQSISVENNLFSGPISSQMVNQKDTIQTLLFSYNSFTGTIPSNFSELTHLYYSEFDNNFLNGTVDHIYMNTTSLLSLDWGSNQFSGRMPETTWPLLIYYITALNYFTGDIPGDTFRYSQFLYYLDLAYNYITGTLPHAFHKDKDIFLNYANFSNNFLSGSINNTFEGLGSLVSLSLSYNSFSQTLPANFGHSLSLYYLFLDNNRFSGTLPDSLNYLKNIKVFFVQNNRFYGQIPTLVAWKFLEIADVSNNQFSGTLPLFLTLIPSIKTFAGSSNCFSGTVPPQVCNLTSFEVFAMNGLSTAVYCRTDLFPGSQLLNAFVLEKSVKGTIPSCLFKMPHLQTLHLAGNGFTGTLPDKTEISDSLQDLQLSHNVLTGTIPSAFQKRTWTELDLSYNKLTGTLSGNFASYNNASSSLTLDVNRLSGKVPSTLLSAVNIDILSGNLFDCDYDRHDLPYNDGKNENYSCGSDVVNAAFYFWVVAVGVIFVGILFCHVMLKCFSTRSSLFQRVIRYFGEMFMWRRAFIEFCEGNYSEATTSNESISSSTSELQGTENPLLFSNSSIISNTINPLRSTVKILRNRGRITSIQYGRIYKLYLFFQKLRFVFIVLTVFILFLLLPFYSVVSLYYDEYYQTYAWQVSGVLLSGATVGALLVVAFTVSLLLLIFLFKIFISPHKTSDVAASPATDETNDITSRTTSPRAKSEANVRPKSTAGRALSTVVGNSTHFRESIIKEHMNYLSYLALLFVGVGNCILMIFADIFYVLVIINENSTVILLAEILLALFKIALNNNLLWTSIPFMRDLLDKNNSKENQHNRSSIYSMDPEAGETGIPTAAKIKLYKYTRNDLLFLSFMILLNNMIFPAIAIIFVSPDCLYNALVSEAAVSSSYSYQICTRYFFIGSEHCLQYLTYSVSTSYSPPFIYSYQCSSIIIINYAAVFILMYIFEGIVQPLFKLLVKFVYDGYYEYGANTTQEEPIGKTEAGLQLSTIHGNPSDLRMSRMSQFIRDHNPSFSDPSRNFEKDEEQRQTEADSGGKSFAQRDTVVINRRTQLTVVYKVENKTPWYYRMLFTCLPYNLTPLVPEPSAEIKFALLLFDKNRIIVRVTAYLMVFMTFGVLFPPLAFILCITVICLTFYEEMVIGRILYESEKLNYPWYKKQIDRNCSGISNGLKYSLWTIVPVSCLFLGYIVFDTFGDDKGWKQALPPALVMLITPILVLAFFTRGKKMYGTFENRYFGGGSESSASVAANSPELPPGREIDDPLPSDDRPNSKPTIALGMVSNSTDSIHSNPTKPNRKSVRLTEPCPINDDEKDTVEQPAAVNHNTDEDPTTTAVGAQKEP
jgi:Leucine-rich repeat (LRR) protein